MSGNSSNEATPLLSLLTLLNRWRGKGRDFRENPFKDTYRHRVGIEGTHSQGVRTMGLRRSRYMGLPKTHLAHVAIATSVNLVQLSHWLNGDVPEQTRTSAFKRVMEQAA